ncbi:cytidine deaminase 1-like [Lycium ferocissimum]|uniref:cytidine deaminase 1-like n=1 Tax=Lycium ferocissimum TaxID=112874 RepID=UPI002814A023|nr:cytidine deaminase 1-like [Lycium ferocissimum]
MDHTKFVLEASEAELMAQSLGLSSVLQLLPILIQPAKNNARPPISNFHVSAVGLGSDGRVFLGVNLEFPGLPLHHTVHAEQFLLLNLAVHNCPSLVAFAVSAAPCGHCRQFLQELRNSSTLQIHITSLSNNNPHDMTFKPLAELLPYPFGPFDLLDDETPLLLEHHNNGLSLGLTRSQKLETVREKNSDHGYLSNGFSKETEKEYSHVTFAALEAANESHAPYSGCPSGVALVDSDGKVYKGSYVESAAYNPSLGPVQAALVAFVAMGGGEYEKIVAAALVEKEKAKVRQDDTARLLLNLVSPNCDIKVFHCIVAEN